MKRPFGTNGWPGREALNVSSNPEGNWVAFENTEGPQSTE